MDGTEEKKNRLQYLNDMAKKYLMEYYKFVNKEGPTADQLGFVVQHMQPGVAAGNLKTVMNTGDIRDIKTAPKKIPPPNPVGEPGSVWREWPEMMDIRRRRIQRQVDELFRMFGPGGELPQPKTTRPQTELLGPQQGVKEAAGAAAATELMTEDDYRRAKMLRDALMLKYMLGGEHNPIKTPPAGGR